MGTYNRICSFEEGEIKQYLAAWQDLSCNTRDLSGRALIGSVFPNDRFPFWACPRSAHRQSQVLLAEIFYGFTVTICHQDAHDEFFAPTTGWFQRFLTSTCVKTCVPRFLDMRHPTRFSARRRHSVPPSAPQDGHLRNHRGAWLCDV